MPRPRLRGLSRVHVSAQAPRGRASARDGGSAPCRASERVGRAEQQQVTGTSAGPGCGALRHYTPVLYSGLVYSWCIVGVEYTNYTQVRCIIQVYSVSV